VDECARLYVAVGVDVQITPSACDTAARILTIVPEIHGEQLLAAAPSSYLFVHELTLLR